MKKIDLKLINGNEIIDFLNEITLEDREDLCDISIEGGSFVFEYQKIKNNEYILSFTASYNNWGTLQEIYDNSLHIDINGIWFDLNEPFEGDGTDEALEKVLIEWLDNHTFSDDLEKNFDKIIYNVVEELNLLKYSEKEKLQNIIHQLIKAKTLIK